MRVNYSRAVLLNDKLFLNHLWVQHSRPCNRTSTCDLSFVFFFHDFAALRCDWEPEDSAGRPVTPGFDESNFLWQKHIKRYKIDFLQARLHLGRKRLRSPWNVYSFSPVRWGVSLRAFVTSFSLHSRNSESLRTDAIIDRLQICDRAQLYIAFFKVPKERLPRITESS